MWQPVLSLEESPFGVGSDSLRKIKPDAELKRDRLSNECAAHQRTAHSGDPMPGNERCEARYLGRECFGVKKQCVEIEPTRGVESRLEQEVTLANGQTYDRHR